MSILGTVQDESRGHAVTTQYDEEQKLEEHYCPCCGERMKYSGINLFQCPECSARINTTMHSAPDWMHFFTTPNGDTVKHIARGDDCEVSVL